MIDDHEEDSSISHVMDQAVTRLLNDEPLPAFCDWFARHMSQAVHEEHSMPAGSEAKLLGHQRCIARTLWAHMPVPSNRWRARCAQDRAQQPVPLRIGQKVQTVLRRIRPE